MNTDKARAEPTSPFLFPSSAGGLFTPWNFPNYSTGAVPPFLPERVKRKKIPKILLAPLNDFGFIFNWGKSCLKKMLLYISPQSKIRNQSCAMLYALCSLPAP